jgi:hypothetical protein
MGPPGPPGPMGPPGGIRTVEGAAKGGSGLGVLLGLSALSKIFLG